MGKGVNVGGTEVEGMVAEGAGDARLGGAEVAQAEIKIKRKNQGPNLFMQTFLRNNLLLSAPGTAT